MDRDYGHAFGGFMGQLTPTERADGRYLFYHLISDAYREFIDTLADGANINNLKFSQLGLFAVPLPALDEQRRIVAKLDEAFEAISEAVASASSQLASVPRVFEVARERMLEQAPGWSEAPLSDLCDIKHGFAFEGRYFTDAGQFVLLTPGNFHETGGYRDRGAKQKFYVGPVPEDFVLDRGDLLVAMTEQAAGLLGSPLLVPDSGRFLHNQRLGRVIGRPHVPWCSEFFFHVFNLLRVRREIHASASGVKVRHTSPTKIGAVRVRFPGSVQEQQTIARALEDLSMECEELAANYSAKLAALTELKKALLHQAFTGAL